MNAIPPSFRSDPDGESVSRLRWAAVAEAADIVAALAGVEPEVTTAEMREFPARLERAEAWRRERAENGIADLAAVLEPGIAALLAVNARGADPKPAATALWREFVAARTAVLALLPSSLLPDQRRPV